MLEPVTITDREDRNHWNGKKDARDAGQFLTSQNRKDHCKWMQMNALSD
jgi:hypothetical protein